MKISLLVEAIVRKMMIRTYYIFKSNIHLLVNDAVEIWFDKRIKNVCFLDVISEITIKLLIKYDKNHITIINSDVYL